MAHGSAYTSVCDMLHAHVCLRCKIYTSLERQGTYMCINCKVEMIYAYAYKKRIIFELSV